MEVYFISLLDILISKSIYLKNAMRKTKIFFLLGSVLGFLWFLAQIICQNEIYRFCFYQFCGFYCQQGNILFSLVLVFVFKLYKRWKRNTTIYLLSNLLVISMFFVKWFSCPITIKSQIFDHKNKIIRKIGFYTVNLWVWRRQR